MLNRTLSFAVFVALLPVLIGCGKGSEENALTPEKMTELRAKESAARQNYTPPQESRPPGSAPR